MHVVVLASALTPQATAVSSAATMTALLNGDEQLTVVSPHGRPVPRRLAD